MNISNELLAAYAEGKVSDAERKAVRQYLMENPEELESVMVMMDKDYELEPNEEISRDIISHDSSNCIQFHDIALSSAAFSPQIHIDRSANSASLFKNKKTQSSFIVELDNLINEIDLL